MLTAVYNGQNMAVYEAYWLMGFPVINHGGVCSPFFVLKHHVQKYKPIIVSYVFKNVNKQV